MPPTTTYSSDYPSLAALDSGVEENAAPSIASGTPHNSGDLTAASFQHKQRKRLRHTQQATDEEVARSKIRKHQVASELASQISMPEWAQGIHKSLQQVLDAINDPTTGLKALADTVNHPTTGLKALADTVNHPTTGLKALADTVNHPTTGLKALADTVNHPTAGLKALNGRFEQEIVRNKNRMIRNNGKEISRMPGADGIFPTIWFPLNNKELLAGRARDISALLQFYGLGSDGTEEELQKRLQVHLGITL